MPSRGKHIIVDGLDEWIDGLANMGTPGDDAVAEWREATEVFYDRTQAATHVLSGDLKASGRYDVRTEGRQIVGTVTYGGTELVDYAQWEFMRGGNHDALTVGFAQARDEFIEATTRAVDAEIDSWG